MTAWAGVAPSRSLASTSSGPGRTARDRRATPTTARPAYGFAQTTLIHVKLLSKQGQSGKGRAGSDGGASGDDHGGAELAPDLGRDVRAEESREEPVVVVAEDDHVGPGVARRVDDRAARLACSPHEVGL